MLWQIEHGGKAEKIIEIAKRDGMKFPDFLVNAPELDPAYTLYLTAFSELSSCRPLGFGAVGPIPWTAMVAWMEFHDIDHVLREDMVYILRAMDHAYTEKIMAKS